MSTQKGTIWTVDMELLQGKSYNDNTEIFSMMCIIYFVTYRQYPADPRVYQTREEIAKLYNSCGVTISAKMGNRDYSEWVDFFIDMISFGERDTTWDTLMKNKLVRDCIVAFKVAKAQRNAAK